MLLEIESWDLSRTRERILARMGWDEDFVDTAIEEYKKFIAIVVLNPQNQYGMTTTIDEVWHEHILDTRDYLAMCDAVAGGMIHHEPRPARDKSAADLEKNRNATIKALKRTFAGPLSALWSQDNVAGGVAKCCSGHLTPA